MRVRVAIGDTYRQKHVPFCCSFFTYMQLSTIWNRCVLRRKSNNGFLSIVIGYKICRTAAHNINLRRSSCKVPDIVFRFQPYFREAQVRNFTKIRGGELRWYVGRNRRTDGRTDRHAKSIGALQDLRQQKFYMYIKLRKSISTHTIRYKEDASTSSWPASGTG